MNAKSVAKRPFSHPLFGSSLSNLVQLIWINGGVSWKYSPQLLAALISATARLPLSLIEKIVYHNKAAALRIFVIYLVNLLSSVLLLLLPPGFPMTCC